MDGRIIGAVFQGVAEYLNGEVGAILLFVYKNEVVDQVQICRSLCKGAFPDGRCLRCLVLLKVEVAQVGECGDFCAVLLEGLQVRPGRFC